MASLGAVGFTDMDVSNDASLGLGCSYTYTEQQRVCLSQVLRKADSGPSNGCCCCQPPPIKPPWPHPGCGCVQAVARFYQDSLAALPEGAQLVLEQHAGREAAAGNMAVVW